MPARTRTCLSRLAALALLAIAPPALAVPTEGLNLAWNHCLGEGTGVQNVTFACNTNLGVHAMTGSFILGRNLSAIIGLEIVVDLASASPSLPAWWEFKNAGTCRTTSLGANFIPVPSDVVCVDWSQGLAVGGIGTYCTSSGPCADAPANANVARIKLIAAVPQEASQDLAAGTEYFAFHLLINHQKTVGDASCSGCETPVCIVLNSIDVVGKSNIGSWKLTTAAGPGTNFVAWQGGGVPVVGALSGCPAATATRRSAWGAVKALYR